MAINTKEPVRADEKDKGGFCPDPTDEAGVSHLLSYEMHLLALSQFHSLLHSPGVMRGQARVSLSTAVLSS